MWQEGQWCLGGLTKSQKRRVQYLRNDELQRKKPKVWQARKIVDKGKGFIDRKPLTKMLVDGGTAVNLMPYSTFRKLGKRVEDLCPTDMRLTDFSGNISVTKGAIYVELTIGSNSLPSTFFVVDAKGTYSILLGRDWIHANCCILSTMHQSLIQWIGDTVEIVPADSSVSIAHVGTDEWNFEGVECFSRKTHEGDVIKVFKDGQQPIQGVGFESFN